MNEVEARLENLERAAQRVQRLGLPFRSARVLCGARDKHGDQRCRGELGWIGDVGDIGIARWTATGFPATELVPRPLVHFPAGYYKDDRGAWRFTRAALRNYKEQGRAVPRRWTEDRVIREVLPHASPWKRQDDDYAVDGSLGGLAYWTDQTLDELPARAVCTRCRVEQVIPKRLYDELVNFILAA